MRLGIDFDNTLVAYDRLFHRLAVEQGVIPADLSATKTAVRDHLRLVGREPVWTELQGTVYGVRMAEADAFPGVQAFFRRCRLAGVPVCIISHKTRYPFLGERHDLHAAARSWLERQGFLDPAGAGLTLESVYFEETKAAKLARIAACGCTHFIDDLPEFLGEPTFPEGVRRFLFDPNGSHPDEHRFGRIRHWDEAASVLGLEGMQGMEMAAVTGGAGMGGEEEAGANWEAWVRAFGIEGLLRCQRWAGGGNNRVFRLEAGGERYLLKRYFVSGGDGRDRFASEQALYGWSALVGTERVPQAVAWDQAGRRALFRWVEGRRLEPSEVDAGAVGEAMALLAEWNRDRGHPMAQSLPVAAEACFSVAEHLGTVHRRMVRLSCMDPQDALDGEVLAWVTHHLAPGWKELSSRIQEGLGDAVNEQVMQEDRVVSPSDFGFHNALREADGTLKFFDFEYAGWDDPAKLVGDFFWQPAVPVGREHLDRVLEAVGGMCRTSTWRERAMLLLPVYGIKWCAIVLNEFCRADRQRREFAGGKVVDEDRRRQQFEKAQALWRRVGAFEVQSRGEDRKVTGP